ncbi:hypothetical protein [Candidatus Accumulibacter sp. ACC003]|uniref:hypothetical protein n=1 Tax=Candidatus Accumulibacter sp. ACC003 TaxID=2823334 RepID=UPI0025BA30AE|nr:hypothetical protein [Candidatus Accumulibacter sp. ACC003]
MSVRFLGRRVYLALLVVLGSARHAGQNPAAARLSTTLAIPLLTLARWRQWWKEQFPLTALWQACCARFMPPVTDDFPSRLLERFVGDDTEAMGHLLLFLAPITVRPSTLRGGC